MYDNKQNNDFGQNQGTPEWYGYSPLDSDFNQASNTTPNDKPKHTPYTTEYSSIYSGEIRGKYVIILSAFGLIVAMIVIIILLFLL